VQDKRPFCFVCNEHVTPSGDGRCSGRTRLLWEELAVRALQTKVRTKLRRPDTVTPRTLCVSE